MSSPLPYCGAPVIVCDSRGVDHHALITGVDEPENEFSRVRVKLIGSTVGSKAAIDLGGRTLDYGDPGLPLSWRWPDESATRQTSQRPSEGPSRSPKIGDGIYVRDSSGRQEMGFVSDVRSDGRVVPDLGIGARLTGPLRYSAQPRPNTWAFR